MSFKRRLFQALSYQKSKEKQGMPQCQSSNTSYLFPAIYIFLRLSCLNNLNLNFKLIWNINQSISKYYLNPTTQQAFIGQLLSIYYQSVIDNEIRMVDALRADLCRVWLVGHDVQLCVVNDKDMYTVQICMDDQKMDPAWELILGHISEAYLATGPVIALPFVYPLLFTITPALSSHETKVPSGLLQALLCLMMTAGWTFFLSFWTPFLTEQRQTSPMAPAGNLFKLPLTPWTAMMNKFLAPELSAQLSVAATGNPLVILSLIPTAPVLLFLAIKQINNNNCIKQSPILITNAPPHHPPPQHPLFLHPPPSLIVNIIHRYHPAYHHLISTPKPPSLHLKHQQTLQNKAKRSQSPLDQVHTSQLIIIYDYGGGVIVLLWSIQVCKFVVYSLIYIQSRISQYQRAMNKKITEIRIRKQVQSIEKQSIPSVIVQQVDLLNFHFCFYGLHEEYEKGFYHGVLELPEDYPFSPPKIQFVTNNGRFEVGKFICTTFTHYHKETWSSTWNIKTILTAMISFMYSNERGIGSIAQPPHKRKLLASKSLQQNLKNQKFVELFKDKIIELNLVSAVKIEGLMAKEQKSGRKRRRQRSETTNIEEIRQIPDLIELVAQSKQKKIQELNLRNNLMIQQEQQLLNKRQLIQQLQDRQQMQEIAQLQIIYKKNKIQGQDHDIQDTRELVRQNTVQEEII